MINKKGISVVEILLALLVVTVIGFGGYAVWNNNQDNAAEKTTNNTSQTSKKSEPLQSINSSDIVKLNSVSCESLVATEAISKSSDWKQRLETSSEIVAIIETYPKGAEYETYFGTECNLSDGSQLVSYSHYYNVDKGDGTLELKTVKGLARFDKSTKLFVDTSLPCENGPPDATAPAAINDVKENIASLKCGGSEQQLTFNISELKYN